MKVQIPEHAKTLICPECGATRRNICPYCYLMRKRAVVLRVLDNQDTDSVPVVKKVKTESV